MRDSGEDIRHRSDRVCPPQSHNADDGAGSPCTYHLSDADDASRRLLTGARRYRAARPSTSASPPHIGWKPSNPRLKNKLLRLRVSVLDIIPNRPFSRSKVLFPLLEGKIPSSDMFLAMNSGRCTPAAGPAGHS